MELLHLPGNEYLLEASLESLHAECIVWVSQLNFWNEEIVFFSNVLHHRKQLGEEAEQVVEVEKECGQLAAALAKAMKVVREHEALLNSLCESQYGDKENCRHHHRVLINEMYSLHNETRALRKRVFKWITK